MKLPDAPFPTPPGVVYRSGRNRGICPRCDVLIVPASQVVRLAQSEHPRSTPDLRRSVDTGKLYHWDGRPISPKPRWFVHARCYRRHYGIPILPAEYEAQCEASFAAHEDARLPALEEVWTDEESRLTGFDIEALLAEMDREGVE